MAKLNLQRGTGRVLTRNIEGTETPVDIQGNPLPHGGARLPVFSDLDSGALYVRVAERMPTGTAPGAVAAAAELTALKPVHFSNNDGSINGLFVPMPTFDEKEEGQQ